MGRLGKRESKFSGSDDSDEDYVLDDEEYFSASDEDFGKSLDVVESEGSIGDDEEFGLFDEEEEKGFREICKSKKKKNSVKKGKSGGKGLHRRKRVLSEEDEDEDYNSVKKEKSGGKGLRKRQRVLYEEDEDEDEDSVNDEDDEEFTPEEEDESEEENEEVEDEDEDEDDEEDYEDEEEEEEEEDDFYLVDSDEKESTVKKKNNCMKARKKKSGERSSRKGREKRRKLRNAKNQLVKKGRVKRSLRKKKKLEYDDDDDDDCDFVGNGTVTRKMRKKNSRVKRRRFVQEPDSDFIPSLPPGCGQTIAEDKAWEREASKLGELKTSVRDSVSLKKVEEDREINQQREPLVRKGKEKVKETESEVMKHICGVCLQEEDKRKLRGMLDCCSHYFCFACIMEWSKVESRCPLCKQRFKSITRVGKSNIGIDLRCLVIPVPERDQVYQPSEEEIRSFIDPYENLTCTECHEGGDDGLMLLCDLCDSPAHTYCVGLGHEVPEGNWYCDGCRPVAVGSPPSQAQDTLPNQTTGSNLMDGPSHLGKMEEVNLTSQLSPHAAPSQPFVNLTSPRFLPGDGGAPSPGTGAGASTVSERRQIHRRIQNLMSRNRMSLMTSRVNGIPAGNLYTNIPTSQVNNGVTVQNPGTQRIGMLQQAFVEPRLQANDLPSSSAQDMEFLFMGPTQLRRQLTQDSTAVISNGPVNLTLWPELSGANPVSGIEIISQSSVGSINGCDSFLTHRAREESHFYAVKEYLQTVVRTHLKSLSQGIGLGDDTFKQIARSSTHTILAACGLEHRRSEVQFVPQPAICKHGDKVIAGQTSMMRGYCSSCFDSFVRAVVKTILDSRLPRWLRSGV